MVRLLGITNTFGFQAIKVAVLRPEDETPQNSTSKELVNGVCLCPSSRSPHGKHDITQLSVEPCASSFLEAFDLGERMLVDFLPRPERSNQRFRKTHDQRAGT